MTLPLPVKKPGPTNGELHQKAASAEPTPQVIIPLRLEECLKVGHHRMSRVIDTYYVSSFCSVPGQHAFIPAVIPAATLLLHTPDPTPFLHSCT